MQRRPRVFVIIPTARHPIYVGSRLQQRRDAGESVRIVVSNRFIADEPMKSVISVLVHDVKIGPLCNRPTNSVYVSFVRRL